MIYLIIFSIFLVIISMLYQNLDYGMSDCTIMKHDKITHTSFGHYDSNFNPEIIKGLYFDPIYFEYIYILQINNETHNMTVKKYSPDQEYNIGDKIKCRLYDGKITLIRLTTNILGALFLSVPFIMMITLFVFLSQS